MKSVNLRKVAMIGCGFVGSASAFALMQSGLFLKWFCSMQIRIRQKGSALDISHGLPFAKPMQIYAGGYDDITDAIIIVSAGASQKPGETRLDLVKKNVGIFSRRLCRKLQSVRSRNLTHCGKSGRYSDLWHKNKAGCRNHGCSDPERYWIRRD